MINAVRFSCIDDGNGFRQQFFCQSEIFSFDSGVKFFNGVSYSGALSVVACVFDGGYFNSL